MQSSQHEFSESVSVVTCSVSGPGSRRWNTNPNHRQCLPMVTVDELFCRTSHLQTVVPDQTIHNKRSFSPSDRQSSTNLYFLRPPPVFKVRSQVKSVLQPWNGHSNNQTSHEFWSVSAPLSRHLSCVSGDSSSSKNTQCPAHFGSTPFLLNSMQPYLKMMTGKNFRSNAASARHMRPKAVSLELLGPNQCIKHRQLRALTDSPIDS